MPRKLAPDLWLFGVAVVLLSVGVVMVYSASAIVAGDRFHDPYFFLKRQLCWALLGAAGLWVALRVDYRRLERFVLPLLVVSGALLVLVLIPPIGQAIHGPRRLILAPAVPLIAIAIWAAPYRLRRITAFLDPWSDPRGSGFQIIQSWLAFGNGGVLGQGIGASKQKLFYLPEAHTDFIFAIVGEELGFLGAAGVIALFSVFVWRGLRIGLRAPDAFGGYLALGITVLIATQTLVNLGVVLGLLPTKGLPLPFMSFGGSALLVTLLSTGVLLNISQHANV